MFHVDEGIVRNRDAWQLWGLFEMALCSTPYIHVKELIPAKIRIKVHGGGGGEWVLVICVVTSTCMLRNYTTSRYNYFMVGRSWPKQQLH